MDSFGKLRFCFALLLMTAIPSCQLNGTQEGARIDRSESRPTAEPLSVMSFNIRYGTADDGPNAWPHRRDLVMRVIRESQADLIGLQEALRFQLDEIRREFPEYDEIGVGRDDGKTAGEYAAILFRRDRFTARESGQFWLSTTPEVPGSRSWGAACTRVCTWARLHETESGESILFLNTHLDHHSEPARLNGVRLILKRIGELQKDEPVILCGDFNAAEGSPPIEAILDSSGPTKWIDTFRTVHPDASEVSTFHAWAGGTVGAKIDYIFASGFDRPPTSAAINRLHDGSRYPSDHFPVRSTFAPAAR